MRPQGGAVSVTKTHDTVKLASALLYLQKHNHDGSVAVKKQVSVQDCTFSCGYNWDWDNISVFRYIAIFCNPIQ